MLTQIDHGGPRHQDRWQHLVSPISNTSPATRPAGLNDPAISTPSIPQMFSQRCQNACGVAVPFYALAQDNSP